MSDVSNKVTAETLDNATARIDRIVWLAAMSSDFSFAEPLEDLLECEADLLRKLFPWVPGDVFAGSVTDEVAEMVMFHSAEAGKLGFVIQMATPVMRPYKGGRSFSWGWYSTAWFYGETLDEALQAGLAWVAERRAAEDAKAALEAV